jgi:hypothetical protein
VLGIGLQEQFWRTELAPFWQVEAVALQQRSSAWTHEDAAVAASTGGAASSLASGPSGSQLATRNTFGLIEDQGVVGALRMEIAGAAAARLSSDQMDGTVASQAVLALAWQGDSFDQRLSHTLLYFPLSIPGGAVLQSVPPEISLVMATVVHQTKAAQASDGIEPHPAIGPASCSACEGCVLDHDLLTSHSALMDSSFFNGAAEGVVIVRFDREEA